MNIHELKGVVRLLNILPHSEPKNDMILKCTHWLYCSRKSTLGKLEEVDICAALFDRSQSSNSLPWKLMQIKSSDDITQISSATNIMKK